MSVKQVRTIEHIFGYVCSIGRGEEGEGGRGGDTYPPFLLQVAQPTSHFLMFLPVYVCFKNGKSTLALAAIPLIIIEYLIIGRAKRAPHWGVESRFCVIYICDST